MKAFKTLHIVIAVVVVALAALFIYGIRTDCPHTAGYVHCWVHPQAD